MAVSIFSLVSKERIADVLGNLQAFTGLAIQLIDSNGILVLSCLLGNPQVIVPF